MPELDIDYKPLPIQKGFHESAALFRAYVGGFGSGKTLCGCQEALMTCLSEPGVFGLIARWTYPELRDTTQRTFFEVMPKELMDRCTYKKSEEHLVFPNGSEILFRYLENAEEMLKSLNLGFFYIDEASEVTEEIFLALLGRLRQTNIRWRRGWITSNPNGHDWIYERFVSKDSLAKETKDNYELFHAPTRENIHLPEDYVQNLERNYPIEWVRRYLEASFDVFEGQIFTEFDSSLHVVDDFNVPADWERIAGFDYGLRNPTAILWLVADFDGYCYIVDEHYEKEMSVEDHASAIKRRGDVPIFADPAVQTRGPTGDAVATLYADQGIALTPANNDVDAGINRIHEYLSPDQHGIPKLRIFKSCKHLIRELQGYRWQPKKMGREGEPERPYKANDHAVDALRYAVMSRIQHPIHDTIEYDGSAEGRRKRHLARLVKASKGVIEEDGAW
jgi:phage terminase large subunit|tara:strand:+ start:4453 stop:5796 length:1344 start_codon:yes stop_codon:yes gene_type:complete